MADIVQRLRAALITALDAGVTIAALTGRASDNLVAWNALAEAIKPVIAYRIIDLRQNGESGDGRDGLIQFTAVAEGNDADSVVQELLGAVETDLTAEALLAAGVDAAPILFERRDGDTLDQGDEDDVRMHQRNLHAAHLDVAITLTV